MVPSGATAVVGEASRLLQDLSSDAPIACPVALVVAHPDDETIGAGSKLKNFKDLRLVHVTNGAPRDQARSAARGFATASAYAKARFEELDRALHLLEVNPARKICFGITDGEAVFDLTALMDRIAMAITECAAVITHAYEGGHPDHDACALAVRMVCCRIRKSGRQAPQHLEFAGYHAQDGALAANVFWPDPAVEATTTVLSWRARRRKARAMRAFKTQSFIMESFPPRQESYRVAPHYDFTRPPPPGNWVYDGRLGPMNGCAWLERVRTQIATEACVRCGR